MTRAGVSASFPRDEPVPGGLECKPLRLTFRHDPDYYDGPGWLRQVLGMQGYFSRFPDRERKPDILRLIGSFRNSSGVFFSLLEPQAVA